MLEVCVKMIESILLMVYGFMVIKKVTQSDVKICSTKNIALILIAALIGATLHKTKYSSLYTICIFALDILIYKVLFNIKIEEALIACGIVFILLFIGDLLLSAVLFTKVLTAEQIRNSKLLYLGSNMLTMAIGLAIVNIKIFYSRIRKFYLNITRNKSISNLLFLALLIVGLSTLCYNIAIAQKVNMQYIVTLISMVVFFILTILFIESKNKYDELSVNYDSLFTYVQNFEDWIEKEQLNRHEYKNQLAVIRCLTKEKNVKDKIDEILEDNINIEGSVVSKLKFLPKGGIKGLMYYKAGIAQKKKINLTVDVDLEPKSILTKLSEQDVRVLCKLIGIYFDNAIEAAAETRKKSVLLEVYEIKDKVTIVLSNTFKKHDNFKDRNKKGVSSKGEGHGNGLYFASKLISSNKWLESKQEIIDNYYIQQLIIHDKKK